MWTLRGTLGAALGDVRRMIDAVCPLCACAPTPAPDPAPQSAPRPESAAEGAPLESPPESPAVTTDDAEPTEAPRWSPPAEAVGDADGPVPPGPWRWRWVWPGPGRPAGMALIAADETLVLWSPGGFASHELPPDGRPTPEVAAALASLPALSEAAEAADGLRVELNRALTTAREARLLLHRAADAVDDAIDRRQGSGPTR